MKLHLRRLKQNEMEILLPRFMLTQRLPKFFERQQSVLEKAMVCCDCGFSSFYAPISLVSHIPIAIRYSFSLEFPLVVESSPGKVGACAQAVSQTAPRRVTENRVFRLG